MKLLLTGFEPFGGSSINPSAQIVAQLARVGVDGVALSTAVLPVDRHHGPAQLLQAVQTHRPDAVLCLGLAGHSPAIAIERVAVNLLDFRIADNSGHQFVDEPIVPDGPAAYFTTLPLRAMHKAALAAGVPTELSLSAGAYLCNQVTYELLHYLAIHELDIPAGFVHVPYLPEQVAGKKPLLPSMSLVTMCVGITAVIQAIVS
ncbi:MAG: pyroglutamyl-peptidase I [Ardenticatenaceae bacterium]|nr:pyroglutamyl-peptidase I [Ardenticatenaceae bacterium]